MPPCLHGHDDLDGQPETASGSARAALEALLVQGRNRDARIASALGAFRMKASALAAEVKASKCREAEALAEAEALRKDLELLREDHRRLYDGFISLLSATENASGSAIGVEQRVEALILSAKIGNSMGDHTKLATNRARGVTGRYENTLTEGAS